MSDRYSLDGLHTVFERSEYVSPCATCGNWMVKRLYSGSTNRWTLYFVDNPVVECVSSGEFGPNGQFWDIRPLANLSDKTFSDICDIAKSVFPFCRMAPCEQERINANNNSFDR